MLSISDTVGVGAKPALQTIAQKKRKIFRYFVINFRLCTIIYLGLPWRPSTGVTGLTETTWPTFSDCLALSRAANLLLHCGCTVAQVCSGAMSRSIRGQLKHFNSKCHLRVPYLSINLHSNKGKVPIYNFYGASKNLPH